MDEFCDEEFSDYCKNSGIQRHRTIRKTLQENRVIERMNRTLLDKSRCMLFNAELPKTFWEEAVMTAIYLVSRCSSSAIEFKTPEKK